MRRLFVSFILLLMIASLVRNFTSSLRSFTVFLCCVDNAFLYFLFVNSRKNACSISSHMRSSLSFSVCVAVVVDVYIFSITLDFTLMVLFRWEDFLFLRILISFSDICFNIFAGDLKVVNAYNDGDTTVPEV